MTGTCISSAGNKQEGEECSNSGHHPAEVGVSYDAANSQHLHNTSLISKYNCVSKQHDTVEDPFNTEGRIYTKLHTQGADNVLQT